MSIINLQNVCKQYGNGLNAVKALDDVTLAIEAGDKIGVVGTSGSGKSTLLNMIGGVDAPTSGRILIDGENISGFNDSKLSIYRRKKVGFVFQTYHLIPVLTVEENIEIGQLLDHKKVDKKYVRELMDMLGIYDRRKHLPSELSGGQQQRVAIARALANHPSIILADEPTGSLDSKNGKEVMDLLYASADKLNQTLIVITHNIDLARDMDRIITIKDGKIE